MSWKKTALGYRVKLASRALRRDAERDIANGGYAWAAQKIKTANLLDNGGYVLVDVSEQEKGYYLEQP